MMGPGNTFVLRAELKVSPVHSTSSVHVWGVSSERGALRGMITATCSREAGCVACALCQSPKRLYITWTFFVYRVDWGSPNALQNIMTKHSREMRATHSPRTLCIPCDWADCHTALTENLPIVRFCHKNNLAINVCELFMLMQLCSCAECQYQGLIATRGIIEKVGVVFNSSSIDGVQTTVVHCVVHSLGCMATVALWFVFKFAFMKGMCAVAGWCSDGYTSVNASRCDVWISIWLFVLITVYERLKSKEIFQKCFAKGHETNIYIEICELCVIMYRLLTHHYTPFPWCSHYNVKI